MKKVLKLIALLCAVMLALAACGGKTPAPTQTTEAPSTQTSTVEAQAVASEAPTAEAIEQTETAAVDGLVIELSSLSEQPLFIDWKQDGTAMQLIALMDTAGTPQLAYNTCQVCAGSPYAYFVYENGVLVCQNCGNRFALSSVGKVSGGCNPMPVEAYENDGTLLIVPGEALAQAASSFKNWKVF